MKAQVQAAKSTVPTEEVGSERDGREASEQAANYVPANAVEGRFPDEVRDWALWPGVIEHLPSILPL